MYRQVSTVSTAAARAKMPVWDEKEWCTCGLVPATCPFGRASMREDELQNRRLDED